MTRYKCLYQFAEGVRDGRESNIVGEIVAFRGESYAVGHLSAVLRDLITLIGPHEVVALVSAHEELSNIRARSLSLGQRGLAVDRCETVLPKPAKRGT